MKMTEGRARKKIITISSSVDQCHLNPISSILLLSKNSKVNVGYFYGILH
jgi:hypothetical protein